MVLCILFAGLPAMDAVGVTARAEETTQYTVSFDSMGGNKVTAKKVDPDTPVSAPTRPTRTYYKFAAWYTDEEYTQEWDFTTPVTGDMTLYARWTAEVTFNGNGAKFGTQTTKKVDIYENTTIAGQAPQIDRAGYTFTGWYEENTCENKWELKTDVVIAKMTLYAGWQINSYKVTFKDVDEDGKEKVVSEQTVEYNKTITTDNKPVPTKTGYTFDKWCYKDENEKEIEWKFGSSGTKVTKNIALYATWKINTCKVTFEKNGGTGTINAQTINYNHLCTEPAIIPEKTGYDFKGWYKDAGCTQPWNFEKDVVTEAITLYAKWEPNIYYEVTIKTQNGSDDQVQQVTHNMTAVQPNDPTKTGYTFKGWYTAASSGPKFSFSTKITGNKTVYAQWTPNEHTMTFDSMGGSAVESKQIQYDKTVTAPSEPTRTGYKFGGWWYEVKTEEGETENQWIFGAKGTTVKGDVALYAKWKRTVTFDYNGGKVGNNSSKKEDIFENSLIASDLIPTPENTGYILVGWYRDSECTEEQKWIFKNDIVNDNITLYARWQINKYKVTFDLKYKDSPDDKGNRTEVEDIEYNSTISKTPERYGYTFEGWYTDEKCSSGKKWSSTAKTPANDLTLYAKWTPIKYKVTLDYNGGSYNGASSKVIDVAYDSLIDSKNAPSGKTFKYDGHTFANEWYTDKECTQGKQWNFAGDKVKGDMTLYAKWTINGYTVTFYISKDDSGKDIVSEVPVEHGKKVAQPDDPTNGDKQFVGWVTSSGGSTLFNFEQPITEDTKVYAKWTTSSTDNIYRIQFNANGHGSAPSAKTNLKSTDKITPPNDPTATGYTFGGWYKDAACNDDQKWNFDTDTVQRSQILYAKWTVNTYQVNFDPQGGSAVDPQTVEYNQKATVPDDPVKEGYTFGSWYKEEACTTPWNFDTDVVTENTTLYAKWTEVVVIPEKYTVTFNMNGHGSDIVSLKDVESGSKIAAPTAPTADGWTFEGWYKDAACSNDQKWNFDTDTVQGSQVLYAKWTVNTYQVSFDPKGGSAVDPQTVEYNQKATAPDDPVKEGYTFGGWYKDEACETPWNFDTDVVTENTTLYAKWTAVVVEPEKYTVSFNMNGHGSDITDLEIVSGSRITAPTAPTAEGYTFGGWYKDEACENAWSFESDAVTKDTTLYAKWTKVEDPGPVDPGKGDHHEVIVGNDTPQVDVGGLDSVVGEAKDKHPDATNVKITMTVEKKEETELPPAAQEIKKEAPSSATLEYLDIGIIKNVDGQEGPISKTKKVIEVKIPFDFSGKTEVKIYREHNGAVESFIESDTKNDSTFILDKTNGFIHIFTQKFSVYAISYKKESTSGGGSTGGSGGGSTGPVSYTITASAGEGGSISPSGSIRVVSYRSLTLTITPEEGYQIADVLVDGKSVGLLSSYTFSSVLAAHSIHAVFEPVETPTPPDPGCPKDESCPAWSYMDVNLNAWYHDGIHYCLEAGLMNGYASDRFGPGDSLTRAQLTQILYNLAGKPLASGPSGFKDVPSTAWYAGAVAWAREAGVVSGYSDTRFAPSDLITREQLAAMIWRYAGSPEAPELALDFQDADEISGYAGSALRWAVAKGIVSGNNGRLEPGKPADRAEAASMIMRFCTEN